MSLLPSSNTPLDQHSLTAIEYWLKGIGAIRCEDDPCAWEWEVSNYSAKIFLCQDELRVNWIKQNKTSQFSFPYGLPRLDIEAALLQGP